MLAHWRTDGFDLVQALGAQPNTQTLAGHTMWWEKQINQGVWNSFEPLQARWDTLCKTGLYGHGAQALSSERCISDCLEDLENR